MAFVTIGGIKKEYEEGTSYLDIAKDHQSEFENDIVLVFVNRKLAELHKKVTGDCTIEFVTTADKPGMQTYHRSAILLMLKSFYEVVGAENIEKVAIDFSLGKGLFACLLYTSRCV